MSFALLTKGLPEDVKHIIDNRITDLYRKEHLKLGWVAVHAELSCLVNCAIALQQKCDGLCEEPNVYYIHYYATQRTEHIRDMRVRAARNWVRTNGLLEFWPIHDFYSPLVLKLSGDPGVRTNFAPANLPYHKNALRFLTIKELKVMLREQNLALTGLKNELVMRLCDNYFATQLI